jgi:hypothetical protein
MEELVKGVLNEVKYKKKKKKKKLAISRPPLSTWHLDTFFFIYIYISI